jgi:hypothetical protein
VASLEQARRAKDALRRALADLGGVTGVGIARDPGEADADDDDGVPAADPTAAPDDYWRLQVNVVDAAAASTVPAEVDGVAVAVRVTGRIEAG